jgi:pyoverdine/dityrosine biosynthesis protein Dit1
MKKITVILIAIVLAGTYSCNKLKHVKFTSSFTAHLTVPATDVINVEHTVFSDTISTDVQKLMNDNQTSKDLINTVKAEAVELVIKSPDAQTFAYIKDVHIFLWAPNEPEVEIAFKANVKEDGKTLQLTVRDIELKPYLTAEKFVVRATSTHQQPLTQDVKIDANIRARFDGNLLAALK